MIDVANTGEPTCSEKDGFFKNCARMYFLREAVIEKMAGKDIFTNLDSPDGRSLHDLLGGVWKKQKKLGKRRVSKNW